MSLFLFLYTPKSKNLKHFYYLGAKAWNSLLDSVINDPNYIVNNAYDYIYKLKK